MPVLKRIGAITVLLTFVTAWGNTYGPSTPEVSKFEPFDATNLVDLYSGDFIYTLPLLEIPGSGGGYPLAISYKAGIPTNDQSSYVGLGWNLTPGFINRHVAGLPDDLYRGSILKVTKDKFSQHFGVGIKDYLSVGGQYDNTQGFSGYARFHLQYTNDYAQTEIGLKFDRGGMTLYSGTSAAGGWVRSSSGISISTNGISATSRTKTAVQGIPFSISSANGNPYIYASGQAYIFEFGFGQQSGTYEVQSYGHLYADEMIEDADDDVDWGNWQSELLLKIAQGQTCITQGGTCYKPVGSLISDFQDKSLEDYIITAITSIFAGDDFFSTKMFQSEAVTEKLDIPAITFLDPNDSKYQRPHIFLSKDGFTVNAQGINGAMVSYRNKRQIVPRTDIFNRTPESGILSMEPIAEQLYLNVRPNDDSRLHDDVSSKHQFRFVGEAGGIYKKESSGIESYGSKRIVYYTDSDNKFITGFSVTKEDGVTYHFMKPAYSTLEVAVSLHEEDPNLLDIINTAWAEFMNAGALWPYMLYSGEGLGKMYGANVDYSMNLNDNKYAYAWLLTSVTGPDFVDMDGNLSANHGDLGYWVKINYSSQPDVAAYEWREPIYGFRPASTWDPYTPSEKLDKGYSCGKKEIYYVHSIETNTHIAEFKLSDRKDAYACRYEPSEANAIDDMLMFTSDFSDAEKTSERKRQVNPFGKGGLVNRDIPLKKLDAIKLYPKNPATGAKESNTVKEVAFAYSYGLCKGTKNSNVDGDGTCGDADSDGKLTLKEIHMKGAGGTSALPPYIFSYNEKNAGDNPSYGYKKWDRWGYYKSNGDADHLVTNTGDVDAWSLRSIATPLGSVLEIGYESDDYARVQNRLAEDALKYEGEKVPVKYVITAENDEKVLSGIELPKGVAGRLLTDDRISFNGVAARLKPFQSDYSQMVEDVVDGIVDDLEGDGTNGIDVIYRILAVQQTILQGIDCSQDVVLCLTCPAIPCVPPFTPLSCIAKAFCYANCFDEVPDCITGMADCINSIQDGIYAVFKEKATILTGAIIDYARIPYEGRITIQNSDDPNFVKILFADGSVKLTLPPESGILMALDPSQFGNLICGDVELNPFNLDTDKLSEVLAQFLDDLGIAEILRDELGSGADVLFPFTTSLEKMMGNELRVTLNKLPPSGYEHPNGTGYQNIVSNLKTKPKTDPVFAVPYYPTKAGGGLRVKRITLRDGLGKSQQWQYFYDFQGNGNGITSGIVTSEPMAYGPEGKDDRVIRQEEEGNFYMAAPTVGYEKVTVVGPDQSKVITAFATSWDYPYVSRRGGTENSVHKYYDPSTIYGRMKKKEYFSAGSTPKLVYSEEYFYDETHYANAQLDPNDGTMGGSVGIAQVAIRDGSNNDANLPLGTVRTTYDNYLMDLTILDFTPGDLLNITVAGIRSNSYQYDIPGFPLRKTITAQDGVKKEIRNLVWDKYGAQPLIIAEKNSDGKWKVSEETPAYHVSGNDVMFQKNMLTQVYQSTVYEFSGNIEQSPPSIISAGKAMQSTVQTWKADASAHNWVYKYYNAGKVYNPSEGSWLTPTYVFPAQIYKHEEWKWRTDPNSPSASKAFSTSNGQWVMTLRTNAYGVYGENVEVIDAVGTYTTIPRCHGGGLAAAEIANAGFYECGVFTCDYDLNEDNGKYFDEINGWEKGGSHITTPPSNLKHFGKKAVHVDEISGAWWGPTKNIHVQQYKDYIFSAWVCPTNGNTNDFYMAVEVWHNGVRQSESLSKPIDCGALLQDKWQYLEHKIKSSDLTRLGIDGDENDFVRIWIGANQTDPHPDFYIDDVRFYPSNALVKSYYYDAGQQLPIAFVDENGKAKYYEYDGLARLVATRNNARQLVSSNEYHFMGDPKTPTEINITYPNWGGQFHIGEVLGIRWRSGVNITSTQVEFSSDGGLSWALLNPNPSCIEPNDEEWGYLSWTIPGEIEGTSTVSNQCMIRVRECETSGSGEDYSDVQFAILQ